MEAFERLQKRLGQITLDGSSKEPPTYPTDDGLSTSSPSPEAPLKPLVLRPIADPCPVELKSNIFKISFHVYHHRLGQTVDIFQNVADLHCWTYISSGLQSIAGGELVLSLKQRSGELNTKYPLDFGRICDKVCADARRDGMKLRRWQIITFPTPLFSRQDFRAIVLGFRDLPVFGLEEPKLDKSTTPYFYGLAITQQEFEVSQKYGLTRALILGCSQNIWFPYAPYVDRDRKSTISVVQMDGSASGPGVGNDLGVEGLNVFKVESNVYLHIPQDRTNCFKLAMQRNNVIMTQLLKIEAEMHESCDSVYYWRSGHSAETLSAGPLLTQQTAMNFLIISTNQSMNVVNIIEDGCIVLLTPQCTKYFFAAATAGREFKLPTQGTSFHLSWAPKWPQPTHSLISGSAIIGSPPEPGRQTAEERYRGSHVVPQDIVFIHEPQTGHVNMDALVDYVGKIDQLVIANIPTPQPAWLPGGCGIIVQVRVPRIDRNSTKIAVRTPREAPALPVDVLHEVLWELPVPTGIVSGDYIEFQSCYSCWGFNWRGKNPPRPL